MNENNKKEENGWFRAGIIAVVLAVTLPFIIMWLSSSSFSVRELGLLGPVGDFYGGSTIGLLSIASIFFIIHTIKIQSQELSLQREELSLTRGELEKTREEHAMANKTMEKQQFETTFFNMINLLGDIVGDMAVQGFHKEEVKGKLSFSQLYVRFTPYMRNANSKEDAISKYEMNYPDYEDILGHYYRHIYGILKFLDGHQHFENETYIEILKSQLSAYEHVFILYHCNSKFGEKMWSLVAKYNLLENLNTSLLFEN